MAIANKRSMALNALSSRPTVTSSSADANVAPSRAAVVGSFDSVLMYTIGRPKLNPVVRASVTVKLLLLPGPRQIFTTLSWTRLLSGGLAQNPASVSSATSKARTGALYVCPPAFVSLTSGL